jgi:hypothetical protein
MPTMGKDVVSFSCGSFDEKYPRVLATTPFVNDISLTQLISEFEKAQSYEPAAGYSGIVPKWPGQLLGKLGAEYILDCECGEVGCWPLQCKIRVVGDDVVWDEFRQPHRAARDYSHFGPFVFEGAQYRDALTGHSR